MDDTTVRRLQAEQWSASEGGLTVAPRRIVDEQGQPVQDAPYWAVSASLYGCRVLLYHVEERAAIHLRGAVYRVLDALRCRAERLQRLYLTSGPVAASEAARQAVQDVLTS